MPKPKRNHYSIQIQFRNDFYMKPELYKKEGKTELEAVKECVEKARVLWQKYKEHDPWKVDIVNELTTKREIIL